MLFLTTMRDEEILYRITYKARNEEITYEYDLTTTPRGYVALLTVGLHEDRAMAQRTPDDLHMILAQTTRAMRRTLTTSTSKRTTNATGIMLRMHGTTTRNEEFGDLAGRILYYLPRFPEATVTAYYR